jgi:hypothetical protein
MWGKELPTEAVSISEKFSDQPVTENGAPRV